MHPKKGKRQVNEKSFDLKEAIIQGWYKKEGDRDGRMNVAILRILLINRHMSYIVTADQIVSMTINRACAC